MTTPDTTIRPIHTAPKDKDVRLALWEPWPINEYRFVIGKARDSDRAMGWLPLMGPWAG